MSGNSRTIAYQPTLHRTTASTYGTEGRELETLRAREEVPAAEGFRLRRFPAQAQ
jgi:hypothetical protein